MTRLGLILLAALATSTRAAWRLDSKMTRPTKLLLATLAAAAATPWPRLDEALANYPSIHGSGREVRRDAVRFGLLQVVVHRLDQIAKKRAALRQFSTRGPASVR